MQFKFASIRKTILGALGCLILFLGVSYTNCGTTEMLSEENVTEPSLSPTNQLENRLPEGVYTATLKDGSKVELKVAEKDRVWVAGWTGRSLSEGLHTVTLEDGRELQLQVDEKDRVWVAGWSSGR